MYIDMWPCSSTSYSILYNWYLWQHLNWHVHSLVTMVTILMVIMNVINSNTSINDNVLCALLAMGSCCTSNWPRPSSRRLTSVTAWWPPQCSSWALSSPSARSGHVRTWPLASMCAISSSRSVWVMWPWYNHSHKWDFHTYKCCYVKYIFPFKSDLFLSTNTT